MPTPKRKPSRPPAVKRLAKSSRGASGRPRASATAPPPATVAAPPPAPTAPLTVEALRELLQSPEGQALRAELLQIAPSPSASPSPAAVDDDGAPFGRPYPPPKSEQVQLRITEREHQLYQNAARTAAHWPEGRPLPIYEALRRLAWEGARARGLTGSTSAAPSGRP